MTQAIILSGGKGTRLQPLTMTTPKPMLPIGGRPHLEYILRLLEKHGITDVIFSTGYLHEQIVEHFGDGEGFGVRITYKEDGDEPLGTAGAIKNCEELLGDEPFLVINGDILTNIDLSRLLMHHEEGITLALAEVEDPSPFGLAVLNEIGHIASFIEKPTLLEPTPDGKWYINAGIYVMDKQVLATIPSGVLCMVESDVFPVYAKDEQLKSYIEEGMYWLDIGTHVRLSLADFDVLYGNFKI